jgi:polyphosphate kinase
MDTLFVHLASPSRLGRMNKLWAAPFVLQNKMAGKIAQVGAAAEKGLPARVVAKMNSLTDPILINALILAGQKGAQIDLIVRGACMLPAGIPRQDRQHQGACYHWPLSGAFPGLFL